MFLGNYQTNLDIQKGRTAVPSNFRKLLGKKAIITKGYEGSLFIVKQSDWQEIIGSVTSKSFLSAYSRQTDRFLLGNAFEVTFDTQGRFVIPPTLREYSNLGKEILFVGVGNRIEVWGRAQWEKNQSYLDENIAQISEKLNEKGTE